VVTQAAPHSPLPSLTPRPLVACCSGRHCRHCQGHRLGGSEGRSHHGGWHALLSLLMGRSAMFWIIEGALCPRPRSKQRGPAAVHLSALLLPPCCPANKWPRISGLALAPPSACSCAHHACCGRRDYLHSPSCVPHTLSCPAQVGITVAGRTLLRPLYRRVAGALSCESWLVLLALC